MPDQGRPSLHWLSRLLPRSIGGQCMFGLLLGILASLLLGPRVALLTPLGQIFLRASQIAVMPYLICELVGSLGSLQPASMRLLSRTGGLVLLAILASGALTVLLLPASLPALTSSAFFSPELLQPPEPPDLVSTYLPFNIFSALADDNFPAVVLFAAVLGVLVQGLPRRELLLEPLEQLRLLFRRLNKLVAHIAPIGILGLTATTLSSLSPELLVRSQALLVLNLVALVLLFVLGFTAIVVLTPLDLAATWRILRGPLALTASSANLLIALPLLNESLREEFLRLLPDADPARQQRALEEISALMPVGFALPNLGQVVSLLFLPFAAWFVDRPLQPPAMLSMLATGIPAVTGGLKSAVRQELQQLGLPANLIGLVQINGEWLYRQEKVLSLLGLALLVILVVSASLGALRFRPAPLLRGGLLLALLAVGLGAAAAPCWPGTWRAPIATTSCCSTARPPSLQCGLWCEPAAASDPPPSAWKPSSGVVPCGWASAPTSHPGPSMAPARSWWGTTWIWPGHSRAISGLSSSCARPLCRSYRSCSASGGSIWPWVASRIYPCARCVSW